MLALGGAVLVTWGSFAPSGGWFRAADQSLAEMSGPATFQPLAPAALVAVVALLMLLCPPQPRLAAGLYAGSGLVLLALFTGVLGSALVEHGDRTPSGATSDSGAEPPSSSQASSRSAALVSRSGTQA